MKKIVCIVGPTGVGKSDISLKIARHFDNEIISGDSVQVYKRLDIGSAKIKDTAGIKHHLIDILEPDMNYSVYDFQTNVREKIAQIDKPLIVGGTGLYVKAALYNYEFVGKERNREADNNLDNVSTAEIYNRIMLLDPQNTVDKNNRRRILRAYQMALEDSPLSKKNKKDEPLFDDLIFLLDMPRDIIYERINKRVDMMFEEGLLLEAQNLFLEGIDVKAIGYSELFQYFRKEISFDEAKELIKKNTRHYAKRQLTWFNNQMYCVRINALDNAYDKVIRIIDNFYKTEIRIATPRDLKDILTIKDKVIENISNEGFDFWNKKYPLEKSFVHDIETSSGYVLLYEGIIAGYISISKESDWGIEILSDYFLGRLMINPVYQSKGLGAMLFMYLFKRFKGRYSLLVHLPNEKAMHFYMKLGFVNNGIVRLFSKEMIHIYKDVK